MPLATKRKVETKKTAPIVDVEPEPKPAAEEPAPVIKVTALVFSYDSAPALRRCLTALEGSNDRDVIEILVVDCGSHDESPGLDSEFPNVTILRLPRYFGRTKALNIGTRTAAGEFLFFLSPEVEVLPTTIPDLVARLEADPDAAAVCPLLMDTTANLAKQAFQLPTVATGLEFIPTAIDKNADAFAVEFASFHAFLVRKYFVKGINYLDERYGESWSDAELNYQIRRASRKTLILPKVTALFTLGAPYSDASRTIREADRIYGAALYFTKHDGFMAGLMLRIKEALKALFTLRLGLFIAIVSGSKIDGSQSVIL